MIARLGKYRPWYGQDVVIGEDQRCEDDDASEDV
jgi:hypothetical protein